MKNKKIFLIIIAVIAASIAVLAGCSKDDKAGDSKNKPSSGEPSSVISAGELETATNADGTPVIPSNMEIVTNSDGTAVTNADGTVVTKPRDASDENATKAEPTTLSNSEKKKLMDNVAANVNAYIESLGIDVDNTLTQDKNEHYAVPASPYALKNGSTLKDCRQAVELAAALQKENPELAGYEVKSMLCYYEKNTFYIVFSPNAAVEEEAAD